MAEVRGKIICILITAVIITSCSAEDETLYAPAPVPPEHQLVTYTFHTKNISSRSSVDEDSYRHRWDKQDKIDVWMGSSSDSLNKCIFQTEEGGSSTAFFTYRGIQQSTRTYFGFYPSQPQTAHDIPLNVAIPGDGSICQQMPDNSYHLKDYQFMYTDRIERKEDSAELDKMQFHHLTSLIVFKLHNESGRTITYSSIRLKTEKGNTVFAFHGNYKAGSNAGSLSDMNYTGSSVSLTLNTPAFTVPTGKMIRCFMPLLPSASFADTRLVFELSTTEGVSSTTFSTSVSNAIKAFQAGHYYVFNLKVRKTSVELVQSNILPWDEENLGGSILPPDHSGIHI